MSAAIADIAITEATRIVAAYVSNNPIAPDNLPDLIASTHKAILDLEEKPAPRPDPAVPINKSIQDQYIICLEDGAKLKMLKRYLRTRYDLSPDQYRERWNLPADYPMVAPEYAKRRSAFAKQNGLGKRA